MKELKPTEEGSRRHSRAWSPKISMGACQLEQEALKVSVITVKLACFNHYDYKWLEDNVESVFTKHKLPFLFCARDIGLN